MSKRTVFTTVTPLPPNITREVVLDFLHDHEEMIDLNPLVKERHPILPPPYAGPDELQCQWFSLTDKISYLPGGLVTGDVTYTCAFHDLPDGLQTHCYAPAGLTIRDKWSVGGSLPGEPPQPSELGLDLPPIGLYIREDVNMKCNVFMAGFVKKTLKKSHAALIERLKTKAETASNKLGAQARAPNNMDQTPISTLRTPSFSQSMSTSAPSSRPGSASSSASSAQSSPSCYGTQTSPPWTAAPSSLNSRPQSVGGPPNAYPTSQSTTTNVHVPPTEQPALQIQYSAPTPAAQEPETPFLQQPPQQWPTYPYEHHRESQALDRSLITAPLRLPQNTSSNVRNEKEISHDALWQALGGKHQRSSSATSSNPVDYTTASDKAGFFQQHEQARRRSHTSSQREYPEMNPYEEVWNYSHTQAQREQQRKEPESSATLRGPFVPEMML